MKMLSAKEWARRGFRIRTGARSDFRGAGGVALFTQSQVTPWDYDPRPRYQNPNIIQVGGRFYREI